MLKANKYNNKYEQLSEIKRYLQLINIVVIVVCYVAF